MAANNKLVDIIVTRADLLIDSGMPQCLTDLCAHSLTLKAILDSWDVEAGGAPDAPPYPAMALLAYLEDSFSALKREQVRLLKAVNASRTYPLTQTTPEATLISDTWRKLESSSHSSPGPITGQTSSGHTTM